MNKAYLPNDAQNLEQKYQTGSDFALDAAARDFGDMRTQPAVVQQTVLAELRTTRLDIAQQEAVLFEQFKALPLTPENMNLRADLLNQIDRLETRDLYLLKATQAQILDMGSVGLLNPLYQKETIAGFGDALGGARLSGKGVSSASINGRIGMLKGAIAEAKAAVAAEKAIAQTKIDLNLYRDWPVASDMVQYRVSQLAERATQNPNADTVILGKYVKGDASSYELVARAQGATYFEFPGKTWSEAELQLGVDKMWSVNKQFLDNQIAQGKSFAFTENPKDATQVKPGSFTHQEFQYLLNNGYSLVYEGGFYRAVKK